MKMEKYFLQGQEKQEISAFKIRGPEVSRPYGEIETVMSIPIMQGIVRIPTQRIGATGRI